MKQKSAKAQAQIAAVKTLEALIKPTRPIYFVNRHPPDGDTRSIIDPVVVDGGALVYIRELCAVLGPLNLHASVPGLASDLTAEMAKENVMAKLRKYVHTDKQLPLTSRWL